VNDDGDKGMAESGVTDTHFEWKTCQIRGERGNFSLFGCRVQ